MSKQYGYGSGFYKILSDDLKKVLPDVKSFSPTNLKYMRYFYELYPCAGNRPQAVDDSTIVFRIPWGHNRTIIDKCKNNVDKALFYVRKTLENNWSRDVLVNFTVKQHPLGGKKAQTSPSKCLACFKLV